MATQKEILENLGVTNCVLCGSSASNMNVVDENDTTVVVQCPSCLTNYDYTK